MLWSSRVRRPTHHIRRTQATNTRPAILLAEKLGLPLNYTVTVNFHHTAATPMEVAERFEGLRARYMRWVKKHLATGEAGAFLWVLENKGHLGAHWLVHVPEGHKADFHRRLPVWLERAAGPVSCPSALHIQKTHNPHGLRKYMLKGIDPAFAALYRIRAVPQGTIYGKRFGFSQNLGPSQCRAHGTKKRWRPPAPPTEIAAPSPKSM